MLRATRAISTIPAGLACILICSWMLLLGSTSVNGSNRSIWEEPDSGIAGEVVPQASLRVLLAVSDQEEYTARMQTALSVNGFESVYQDIAGTTPPGPAVLSSFDVIITWTRGGNLTAARALEWGNALADYVDGGGKVILSQSVWSSTTGDGLAGRIMDGSTYSPFTQVGDSFIETTACLDYPPFKNSIIFEGIGESQARSICDSLPQSAAVADDAILAAIWSDAGQTPFIAINKNGNVIGITSLPSDANGSVSNAVINRIYVNAVKFLVSPPPVIDTFTADPDAGSALLEVTFTCAGHAQAPGADIVSRYLDFGDGDFDDGFLSQTVHIYVKQGSYDAVCTVEDTLGRWTSSAPKRITVGDLLVRYDVSSPGVTDPSRPIDAYRMIGIPVIPVTPYRRDIFTALGVPFGGKADPAAWRLFMDHGEFLAPGYKEISRTGLDTIDYGKGWWLITADPVEMKVWGVPREEDVLISLRAGYQMLSSPFVHMEVSWDQIRMDNYGKDLGPHIYSWEGDGTGEYVDLPYPRVMDVGKAYWVWSQTATSILIKNNPIPEAASGAQATPERAAITQPPPPPPPGAEIRLISPNAGDRLKAGTVRNIRWTSSGISPEGFNSRIRLSYSTNGGKTYSLIKAKAKNTGSYRWRVPAKASNRCLIKAISTLYPPSTNPSPSLIAVTDGFFSIGLK